MQLIKQKTKPVQNLPIRRASLSLSAEMDLLLDKRRFSIRPLRCGRQAQPVSTKGKPETGRYKNNTTNFETRNNVCNSNACLITGFCTDSELAPA